MRRVRHLVLEVMMKEQDKRAVESMCRCGLSLEGVIDVFPMFPKEEIAEIYESIKGLSTGTGREPDISINCS